MPTLRTISSKEVEVERKKPSIQTFFRLRLPSNRQSLISDARIHLLSEYEECSGPPFFAFWVNQGRHELWLGSSRLSPLLSTHKQATSPEPMIETMGVYSNMRSTIHLYGLDRHDSFRDWLGYFFFPWWGFHPFKLCALEALRRHSPILLESIGLYRVSRVRFCSPERLFWSWATTEFRQVDLMLLTFSFSSLVFMGFAGINWGVYLWGVLWVQRLDRNPDLPEIWGPGTNNPWSVRFCFFFSWLGNVSLKFPVSVLVKEEGGRTGNNLLAFLTCTLYDRLDSDIFIVYLISPAPVLAHTEDNPAYRTKSHAIIRGNHNISD